MWDCRTGQGASGGYCIDLDSELQGPRRLEFRGTQEGGGGRREREADELKAGPGGEGSCLEALRGRPGWDWCGPNLVFQAAALRRYWVAPTQGKAVFLDGAVSPECF